MSNQNMPALPEPVVYPTSGIRCYSAGQMADYASAYAARRSEALRRERDSAMQWLGSANAELEKCADLLPGTYYMDPPDGGSVSVSEQLARMIARLEADKAELVEALKESIDLAWIEDSHAIQLDGTVVFSSNYDFSGIDGCRRQEFYGKYSAIIWPGSKWSAYCTYEGSMWFEKFDSAEEAKDACMRLLDRVLPEHPAMKARAVLANHGAAK
ncbi:hypothetical protein ACDA63_07375 [Uliginosibacterium sp. sgz301328]|uniref:hypothetical protein n=1 Tax=Uliginosibacterium sp. sgz301328 TaxID=3243764 RepID=UPI00359EA93C